MMQIDNDFRDLLHQKKTSKLKVVLIVTGIILLVSLIGWGLFAYYNQATSNDSTHQNDTPKSVPQNESSPTMNDSEDAVQEATTPPPNSTSPGATQNNSSQHSNNSTSNSPPSSTKPYDPSKCEPLNVAATNSRQAADQKKITYDNAFTARKNYGYYYDKYGNSVDAQREYNAQEALLSVLQKEWSDALTASNSKYTEYQECRATL